MSSHNDWCPKTIRAQYQNYGGNSLVVEVDTDCGRGFLKAMNTRHTPHDLACELVGTALARLLRLPTVDYAVITIPPSAPIELRGDVPFTPGPGFISRRLPGTPWAGQPSSLREAVNAADIGRLVAFDTWLLNCDRYRRARAGDESNICNFQNIFLSTEGVSRGQVRIVPIDHANCIKCNSDLSPALLNRVAPDPTMFGFFQEFSGFARLNDALAGVSDIESLSRDTLEQVVDQVPRQWLSCDTTRTRLVEVLAGRARGLVRRVITDHFTAASLLDAPPEGEGNR